MLRVARHERQTSPTATPACRFAWPTGVSAMLAPSGMFTVAFQSERGTPPLAITDGGDGAGTRRARSRRSARQNCIVCRSALARRIRDSAPAGPREDCSLERCRYWPVWGRLPARCESRNPCTGNWLRLALRLVLYSLPPFPAIPLPRRLPCSSPQSCPRGPASGTRVPGGSRQRLA